MSCTPWSNEKERADYYENLYNEQFAELDELKRDTVPKLQSALDRANKYGVELEAENKLLREEIKNLGITVNNTTEEFLNLHEDYQMQKAEIERLEKEVQRNYNIRDTAYQMMENIEKKLPLYFSDAIKEFAERLKERKCHYTETEHTFDFDGVDVDEIDNLVKEMTEEG